MTFSIPQSDIQTAKALIKSINLPRVPESLTQLQSELQKEEIDVDKVAEVISTDINLSGTVLKIVNSAQFGLQHKITSIRQATVALGLNVIKNTVLAAALRNTFAPDTDFQSDFWDRANACAQANESLSHSVDGIRADDAFIAGLFQDAGALVCEKIHPRYPEVFQHAHSAITKILEIDRKMFKTTHVALSYVLAKDWNIPDHVCNVIANSHVLHCDRDNADIAKERALNAMLKTCNFFVGTTLHPELKVQNEGISAFEASLDELMVDEEVIEDIRQDVIKFLSW
ncbi:MAG: HDOD domain-containing protein [Gammaproteobacteria bacterium]|jgi:HD-like signal output (HDOD) protein|nr:HDOD domain-containing protein [Gammaproteobacteria bacterium]MBT3489221.1 HDOD domain-containing protein [Gammaproteobacteria bacterium]MBT3717779.1 HDOD domain-containing protein [Gammaproteobacteria bacterium]MBT3845160.1 HDOD domain-containing protein [Gammaproteobacteria bacterium]MBT3894222.1 HDOD domain-containing protein [Gammaproteobacteria bacterium]